MNTNFKLNKCFFHLILVSTVSFLFGLVLIEFFIDIYGPKSGTPIIGADEVTYYERAMFLYEAISREGFYSTFQNFYTYSQSLHFGNYYFLASVFIFLGADLKYVIITKIFIYLFITVPLFYQLLKLFWREKYAYYSALSLIFYLPLVIFNYTVMRDDLIFLLTVAALYCVEKSFRRPKLYKVIITLVVIWLLAAFRIHMALAVIVYFFVKLYINQGFSKNTKYALSTMFLIVLFFKYQEIINFLLENSIFNNLMMLPLSLLRAVLSPLPWQISDDVNSLLKIWYQISFPAIIIIIIILSVRIKNLCKETLLFAIFVICYILPYAGHDGLGFRQSVVIMPFLFLCVFIPVIFKNSINKL